MWNSTDGGFDGGYGGGSDGGFMNTQSQFASPAAGEAKKPKRTENVVPTTIHSILQAGGETFTIHGQEVHFAVLVGLIRSVDVTSTKVTYMVDDTTGTLEVVQWIDSQQEEDNFAHNTLMERTYCKVFGTVRSQQGKHYVLAIKIVAITDLNMLTTHLLDVMHTHLKIKQLNSQEVSGMSSNPNTSSAMPNSLVGSAGLGQGSLGSGGFSGMMGLNAQQNMVLRVITECGSESGFSRDSIYSTLVGKLTHQQVDQVLELLSGEGHIYTTIDDDHFKATDG